VNTKALGVILRKIGEKERDAAERIASDGAEIPRYTDDEEEEESNDNSGVSALVDLSKFSPLFFFLSFL
jgi:hypothetical protein